MQEGAHSGTRHARSISEHPDAPAAVIAQAWAHSVRICIELESVGGDQEGVGEGTERGANGCPDVDDGRRLASSLRAHSGVHRGNEAQPME
jgi:hypothetical protein